MKKLILALLLGAVGHAQVPQLAVTSSMGAGGAFPFIASPSVVFTADANHTMVYPEMAGSSGVMVVTSTLPLTATRNLVAPLSKGFTWLVKNQTTGGQAIQIIGATGSGVSIASGATLQVYSDGVNYTSLTSTGAAQTAAALAGTPTLCSAGYAPTGILPNGNATGCQAFSGGGGSALGPTNYIGAFIGTGTGGQSALGGIPTTSDSTSSSVKIANRWTARTLAGANEADTFPDPADNRIAAWHGIMTGLAATQNGWLDVPPDYQALNALPWLRLDGVSLWNDGTALIDRRYGIENRTFFNPSNVATNNELHSAGGKTCIINKLASYVPGDNSPAAATACDSLGMISAIGGWNYGGGNVYNSTLQTLDFEFYSQGIGNTLTAYCNHYGHGDNNCLQAVINTLFGNTDGAAEGVKTHRDQVDQANIYRATVGAVTANPSGQTVLTLTGYGSNTIGAGHNVLNTTPAKMYTANWAYNSNVNGGNSFALMDLSSIQLGSTMMASVPVSTCATIATGGGPSGVVPNDGTQAVTLALNNPSSGTFNTTDLMFFENDDVPEQAIPTAVTAGSGTSSVTVQLRGYHPAGEYVCQGGLAGYAANMVHYSGAGSHYVQYVTGSTSPTQVRVGYFRAGVAYAFTNSDSVQLFPASTVVAPMNPNTGAVDGGAFTIQQAGNHFAAGDTIELPVSISGLFTNHSLTTGIYDPYVLSQYDNAIFPGASLLSAPLNQFTLANQTPSPGVPGIGSEGGLLHAPESFLQLNGVVYNGLEFLHPPESALFKVGLPDSTSTVSNYNLFDLGDGTNMVYFPNPNGNSFRFFLNNGRGAVLWDVNGTVNSSAVTTGSLLVGNKLPCLQDGTNCPTGTGGGGSGNVSTFGTVTTGALTKFASGTAITSATYTDLEQTEAANPDPSQALFSCGTSGTIVTPGTGQYALEAVCPTAYGAATGLEVRDSSNNTFTLGAVSETAMHSALASLPNCATTGSDWSQALRDGQCVAPSNPRPTGLGVWQTTALGSNNANRVSAGTLAFTATPVTGDLLVVYAVCNGFPATPSGWAVIGSVTNATYQTSQIAFSHTVISGEANSYAFAGGSCTYAGYDVANAGAVALSTFANGNTASLTPNGVGQLALSLGVAYQAATPSPNSGWTRNQPTSTAPAGSYQSFAASTFNTLAQNTSTPVAVTYSDTSTNDTTSVILIAPYVPTPAFAAGAGAGTGASLTVDSGSTPKSGGFTLTTGSSPSNGLLFTATYAYPLATAAFACTLAPRSLASAGTLALLYQASSSTTAFAYNSNLSTASGTVLSFAYSCQ